MIDFRSNTCAPMPGISNGMAGASSTSISTSALSRLPSAKRWRKLCRVASLEPLPVSASSSCSIAASSAAARDLVAAPVALEPNRFLDEVARDLLDVAADVADLGELGRLDLDERRVGELRKPAADLGLAAAGRADHEDVLGRDLVAQLGAELLPPPAVAKRDGDRLLGVVLPDDMLVERGDDRLGCQLVFQHFGLLPAALGNGCLIVHFTANVGTAVGHFKRCGGMTRKKRMASAIGALTIIPPSRRSGGRW